MTTHPDDQPVFGFGASDGELAPRPGRRSADAGGTLRPRRLPAPEWGRHPSPRDVQRYYLCSEEPSGEFVEVIIPVTDAGRIRYFTTSDGDELTEVDEDYFVRRREGNARSLLELDAREMAELQAELDFVRPVLGRDPLAEAAESAAAADSAELAESSETAMADVAEPASLAPTDDDQALAEGEPTEVIELPFPVPVNVPAFVQHVEPNPEPAPEPPALEADPRDRDDDDDQMIEEYHPVIGSNRFEQVEPGASAMPANVTQMPISVTGPVAPLAPAVPAAQPGQDVDAAAQVALAKGIAFAAHRGQLDQIGAEYIDHPGRVAERFDPVSEPVLVAAAWLHDVLEDTAVTAQNLLEAGVQPEVVEIVQLLTRTPDVSDDAYYARIARHPVARRVKLADLDDNTAPWRVRRLEYDVQVRLAEKYRHAREALSAG
ncbi:hypothetical protein [Agromyces sp. Root1464]|uniref:hypothetical protein n=1 Tax=Agromyces sp. Root1464 TaxID=1736467 RepID=UPI000B31EC25|nr:hypothetical protein [Agromyces sp. Root1464]